MNETEKKEINIKDMDLSDKGSVALGIGVIGLVVMAVMTLVISLEFIGASPLGWGFSGLLVLDKIVYITPWYLVLGMFCLVYSGYASELYEKDLRVVGAFNVLGLFFLVFGTIFYWFMWLVCVVYYGLIFGWLVRRMKMRQNVLDYVRKMEKGTEKGTQKKNGPGGVVIS